jgi:hypothetical protein
MTYLLFKIVIFLKYTKVVYFRGLGMDSGILLKCYLKMGCKGMDWI